MDTKAHTRIKILILVAVLLVGFALHTKFFGSIAADSDPHKPISSTHINNIRALSGYTTADQLKENSGDYDIYKLFPGMEKPYRGPLPWEALPEFVETIIKHETPVLMAAFKAYLPVPVGAERENIGIAAGHLAGTVVLPGETFSQNSTIGPYLAHLGYREGPTYVGNRMTTTVGGGVCKVATMLYNVATFSDLKILTRHPHSMIVPYVPPGQDATVFYGAKDLRFLNDTKGPIVIWSQKVDKNLFVALYGREKPPEVTWHHFVKSQTAYQTEYRYNPKLSPGTEKEVKSGLDGYVVNSWVTVEAPNGTVTIKKKGTSWYNASPRIIERGPESPQ